MEDLKVLRLKMLSNGQAGNVYLMLQEAMAKVFASFPRIKTKKIMAIHSMRRGQKKTFR